MVTNYGWCSASLSFRTIVILTLYNDGPLLFLLYIPEGLFSNVELFADDTPIFWVVRDSSS